MKHKLWPILLLSLLIGCREQRAGQVQEEQAQVVQKYHRAGYYTPVVSVDADGDISIDTDYVEPIWWVKFRCQHGEFRVNGDHGRRMYDKLSEGQNVYVLYNEVFYVNKKDNKESLEHKDFDFLDADHKPFTLEK